MHSPDENMGLLLLINLVAAVYPNMVVPFTPLFIRGLGASVFQVSLVFFVGASISTGTILPSGLTSDKYGKKD